MRKIIVIHPFLFAVYPIIFLLSYNIEETKFTYVLLPIAITLAFSALMLLLFRLFKVSFKKTGIIISFFWVLFFLYGHVYEMIIYLKIGGLDIGRHRYLLIFWLLNFLLISIFTIKSRKKFDNITKILNIIGFVLILMPLSKIAIYTINQDENIINNQSIKLEEDNDNLENHLRMPDIYYIILDAYGREDVLLEFFDYNNADFINYLKSQGFFIGSKSFANYPRTPTSLASSLNMDYLHNLESYNVNDLYRLIQDSKAMNFLKNKGYVFINFDSGWGPTSDMIYSDIQFRNSFFNEFSNVLFQTTILVPFSNKLLRIHYDRVLFTFSELSSLPSKNIPKFILAHINCPHPPWVFNRDGTPTSYSKFLMEGEIWEQQEAYIDQLAFINIMVKDLINNILTNSESLPIIILQSDHGPSLSRMPSDPVNKWTDKNEREYLKKKMAILNAYYLPPGSKAVLYDSISPVNSFRTIFNEYHNANFDMLEDRHYFLDKKDPFKAIEVTDRLH